MFWRCVPTCLLYCIVEGLDCCFISFSALRETFKVNLWLMRCLKSSQFVCLLLKFGWFSLLSARDVSVIKTGE
jgi:hypothetical protein